MKTLKADDLLGKVSLIAEHSIGIGLPDKTIHKIIKRGTCLPVMQELDGFFNTIPTTAINICLYQGDDKNIHENDLIGTLRIDGLDPSVPAGGHRFKVIFKLDESGILTMTVFHLNENREYFAQFDQKTSVGGDDALLIKRESLLSLYDVSSTPAEVKGIYSEGDEERTENGEAEMAQGKHEADLKAHDRGQVKRVKQTTEIDDDSLGKNHPEVAISLNNRAQLLQATNHLSEAEPLYRRALKIDEDSFGKDHPTVARDLNNLAQLLQDTNRLSEAEPLSRRAVEILINFPSASGYQHPHLQAFINNYGGLLQAMGWSEGQIYDQLRKMAPEFFK